MKKLIKRFFYCFLVAYKNIIYSKVRSLTLFFTFSIVLIVTIMSFSLKNFINGYVYHEYFSMYNDIDLKVSVDENTNARYFSIRYFESEIPDLATKVNFMAPVFELSTIMEKDQNLTYVNVIAANVDNLSKIVDNEPFNNLSLASNQIIISKSISSRFNVDIGDNLSLVLGEEKINFEVILILEETGLLQKNTVLVDKDSNINYFLTALAPELGNLNPLFTRNLYNNVYIDAKDGVSLTDLKNEIQQISYYQKLVIDNTINYQKLDQLVYRYTNVILLIFYFIIAAVFLVMQSIFQVILEDKKKQISIINQLGGTKLFSFLILNFEILCYLFVGSLLAIFSTNIVINQGLRMLNTTYTYQVTTNQIIVSIISIYIIFLGLNTYNFIFVLKRKGIKINKKKIKEVIKLIFTFSLLIIFILINNILTSLFMIEVKSLLNILIAGLLTFFMVKYLIMLFRFLINKIWPKTIFNLVNLKDILNYRAMKTNLNVLLTSFIIIILVLMMGEYMNTTLSKVNDEIIVDYTIINIIHNYDKTYQELENNENIETLEAAHFYSNVTLKEANYSFSFALSSDNITKFYNLNIADENLNKLNDCTKAYILLPDYFHYVKKLNIDNEITLSLSKNLEYEKFFIAGFFDMNLGSIIITNIHQLDKYNEIKPNAIFIKAKDNEFNLKYQLIQDYSKEMYYIFDINEYKQDIIDRLSNLTNYGNYLSIIVLLCFVLTIINNSILLFEERKLVYAKVRVLGCSKLKLIANIILENIFILFCIILAAIFMVNIISLNLSSLLIFFKSYANIKIGGFSILQGVFIFVIIYLFSYLVYYYRLARLSIVNAIKTF